MTADGDQELLNEHAQIRQALIRAKGNVMGAARLLGLSRSALRYRLRRYGIAPSHPGIFSGELSAAHASPSLVGERA